MQMIRRALPIACFLWPLIAHAAAKPDFDLVLSNGRVVDGSGAPWFRADVGIRGDRIVAIGDLSRRTTARRIDVQNRMVAPGFIDLLGQSQLYVLIDNRVESKIRQGITTEITGEGTSVAPVSQAALSQMKPFLDRFRLKIDWKDLNGYTRRFETTGSAINLGTFVGAAQVRIAVLGLGDVQPSAAQLAEMEKLVEVAMKQGARGLSTALIYPPGSYAKTPELIALAKVAAKYGGVYASHIRGEADNEMEAVEEALTIGREARIPVEIWHLKVAGRSNWGKMKGLLERIEPVTFGEAVMERFKQQCGPRWGMVAEAIEAGASPHHNFHVFTVYPWLGMLMTGPVEQPLKVLDQCRIRWGQVEALAGDTAAIRSEPLEWRGGRLILGPERLETATVAVNGAAMVSDLRVGDWVSLHWHWVCDRLTRRQLSTLRYYTQRLLAIANGAVRSSSEATFSTRH